MAEAAKAPIICGKNLVKKVGSETLLVGPRGRGVKYDTSLEKIYPIDVGEVVNFKEFQVKGLNAVHGPIKLKLFGLIKLEIKPGPGERIGLGAIGFEIIIDNKVIVNLGDTLLQREWEGLNPDILMIPIGGRKVHNTMNEKEALDAVKMMSPKMVIPCHYDCGALLSRKLNQADADRFKREVEKMDIECIIMQYSLLPSEFYERLEQIINKGQFRCNDIFILSLLLDSLIVFLHMMRPGVDLMSPDQSIEQITEQRFEAVIDLLENGLFSEKGVEDER